MSVSAENVQPATAGNKRTTDRARQSVEEGLHELNDHLSAVTQQLKPSGLELLRQSAIKAAVFAPVAFGVGWGLLKIAGRKLVAK